MTTSLLPSTARGPVPPQPMLSLPKLPAAELLGFPWGEGDGSARAFLGDQEDGLGKVMGECPWDVNLKVQKKMVMSL